MVVCKLCMHALKIAPKFKRFIFRSGVWFIYFFRFGIIWGKIFVKLGCTYRQHLRWNFYIIKIHLMRLVCIHKLKFILVIIHHSGYGFVVGGEGAIGGGGRMGRSKMFFFASVL